MDSEFKPEDAKPSGDTTRNLALAVCYSGLFLLVAGAVSTIAIFAIGSAPIASNLSYLVAVAFYLGLVVLAMVGVAFTFTGADTRQKIPAVARGFRHHRRR
jgi:hypothetical protein